MSERDPNGLEQVGPQGPPQPVSAEAVERRLQDVLFDLQAALGMGYGLPEPFEVIAALRQTRDRIDEVIEWILLAFPDAAD